MNEKAAIGIIGMGVMGKSLALNFAGKGVPVAVYNRHVPDKEVNIASEFAHENKDRGPIMGFDSLADFFHSLEKPRKILLMVTAGQAIDSILQQLLEFLSHGDVVMDGGNSFYKDTFSREEILAKSDIHYIGLGISGGEEGALNGPSLMPGGNHEGYNMVSELLQTVAAKDKNGNPCCTYLGPGGAGHFVKMVHNGIEYAEMQLLAETYDLLKRVYKLSNDKIAEFLQIAQREGAGGFLTEVTIGVLNFKENDQFLLDKILDRSEQKGTGSWTVQSGMEYGMPLSTISEAVMARYLSSIKDKRLNLGEIYNRETITSEYNEEAEHRLIAALNTARLINHLSGFDLIEKVSQESGWNIKLSEVARIWTNGCIIRSELMEKLSDNFTEEPEGWKHPWNVQNLNIGSISLAGVLSLGLKNGISLPVMSAALNLFYGITTPNSAANLIQAQRDFFGAHTYQRTDKPKNQYFHTEWLKT